MKSHSDSSEVRDLDDHLDLMFGVDRRQVHTGGSHVEIWREPHQAGSGLWPFGKKTSGRPYFRKRFKKVKVGDTEWDYSEWTEREFNLIRMLESKTGSPHVQVYRKLHKLGDGAEEMQTEHAGPTVQQWLDLPVLRGEEHLPHVFHDCAHWFALARTALESLRHVHEKGFVHLDIKPDNFCVPPAPNPYDPASGAPVRVDIAGLRLIDYAFSVWERVAPLGRTLGMDILDEEAYQSRQLCDAIARGKNNDLDAIKNLDWRADFYGLGWMMGSVLAAIPSGEKAGEAGWSDERRRQAEELVAQLKSFDDAWSEEVPLPPMPHARMIAALDDLLGQADLQQSLATPWSLNRDPAWRPGIAAPPTKIIAGGLRDKAESPSSPIRPTRLLPFVPNWKKWQFGTAAAVLILFGGGWYATANGPDGSQTAREPSVTQDQTQSSESIETAPKVVNPLVAETSASASADVLGERLSKRLREVAPAQFASAEKPSLSAEAEQVDAIRIAAADNFFRGWGDASYGDPRRPGELERLLWLAEKLPSEAKNRVMATVAERYGRDSDIQNMQAWWKNREGSPDAVGQAWLGETEVLARAGVKRAHAILGFAWATGKSGKRSLILAGESFARALQGVTAQTLGTSDRVLVNDLIITISSLSLVGRDQNFSKAILPGLKHVAELGDPAAAWVLANVLACRLGSPKLAEARRFLQMVAKDDKWKGKASERQETIENPAMCEFDK